MNRAFTTSNSDQRGKITTVLDNGSHRFDCLYRVAFKALIYNEAGQVLVVKETGRSFWDLPGGGMDFDETAETSLARELYEEVGYEGGPRYQVFDTSEQIFLGVVIYDDMMQAAAPLSITEQAGAAQ